MEELTPDMTILGELQLQPNEEYLINKWAPIILAGSEENARKAFQTIFERTPADDLEFAVFTALCTHVMDGYSLGNQETMDAIKAELEGKTLH